MAIDTPLETRSLVIYQAFARNHGPTGRLADLTADVPRIAALGVDVLYVLPVHPIGELGRKGGLGSPYAISDFRALNPDLGTDQDFDDLVAAAHDAGLRVMIDVVFNHTSPDSRLVAEYPEFFHRDEQGKPVTSVPQWSDIIDLAHPRPELTRYLIDSLAIWVRRGADGFRCDVASLIPVDFWAQARRELAQIKPGLLWMAETVHAYMIEDRRARGLQISSDSEMFEAFDIEYTYDIWPVWQSAVIGALPVGRYLEMVRWQDAALPGNYAKLRHVENHDNFRIMRLAPSRDQAIAWTALTACLRGPFMIYAGQESGARKWPTLFEHDPIDWGSYELSDLLTRLAALKKHPAIRSGGFRVLADEPCVQIAWGALAAGRLAPPAEGPGVYGVFNVGAHDGPVEVQLPDGGYRDLLTGQDVAVSGGKVPAPATGVVVEFDRPFDVTPWESPLMDVFLHVEQLGDD